MVQFSCRTIRQGLQFVSITFLLTFLGMVSADFGLAQAPSTSTPMKIGIIGSGNIGGTLGTFWAKAGHQVLFSSRNPENLKPLVEKAGSQARAGTVREAIAFGDVILVAVPYGSMPQIASDYSKHLAGKIVIDTGNAVLARDGEIAKEAREKGVGLTRKDCCPARGSCARSTPWGSIGCATTRTVRKDVSASRWPETIHRR